MLKPKDINAIDACIKRPYSVWERIKSIITAEKYTWYLESLAKVKIMPNIAEKKAKWDAMDADRQSEYMNTEDYDEDLRKVLQQVATVLGGVDKKKCKFDVGANIEQWINKKTPIIERDTAFKVAIAFRFTIEETRQLLRPYSVWEGIKSIITAEKYTWYLESLAKVKIMPNIAERKAKWDAMEADRQSEYMNTEDYDEDLRKVLQQVATVLGGVDKNKCKFDVGANIGQWINKKTPIIERDTAFKVAIAFRFTIEETRQLLFTVLEQDEQMDFNPRLPNEMIYAYAIINGIPMNGKQNKDNEVESPQTSVMTLLYEAKLQFLEILFGGENASYFPKLIEIADGSFNILDSVNMTRAALLLAAIQTSSVDVLLKNITDEDKEDSSQINEETTQTERRPTLFPDTSVIQRCYEYASYDQEDKFYVERVAKPVLEKVQISRDSWLDALEYVISILKAASRLVNQNAKGSDRRVAVYSDLKGFIEKCIESVEDQSEKSVFSILDFLEVLGGSNLGRYSQSEFTAMIDNIIIKKLADEWEMHSNENKDNRTTSYHGIEAKVGGDQVDYFRFFFNALKVAIRDLRALTARGCRALWPAYVKMNRILAYSYFSDSGVGMRTWVYENEKIANCCEYTYTIEKLQYNLEDAEDMPDPSAFIENLLSDVHCFEYFNHTMISRGKEKFVADLDDKRKLISRTQNTQSSFKPLFLLQEDNTFTQDDNLKNFYHYRRFQKQYYTKTIPYSRSDILKLAFWAFLAEKKKYNPELGPVDFTDYFDTKVAPDTCCAEINESNSLDRFLLLCLEHEDPIQFLMEAIAYLKTLSKKESKNF